MEDVIKMPLLTLYKITPHLYDIIRNLLHYCILSKW